MIELYIVNNTDHIIRPHIIFEKHDEHKWADIFPVNPSKVGKIPLFEPGVIHVRLDERVQKFDVDDHAVDYYVEVSNEDDMSIYGKKKEKQQK
jgi:hypothetical protein